MRNDIIQGYRADAAELIPRYENLSSSELYRHLVHLFPTKTAQVLDIGAGTGRDAAWLAAQGHDVLAVEPVEEFRKAGASLHGSTHIEWLDDELPDLSAVLRRQFVFDLVLLSGVWQHITTEQRSIAMPHLRQVTSPTGHLILSVRHGSGAPTRHCFEAEVHDVVNLAIASGFKLVFSEPMNSIQKENRAKGVKWTWLAFSPV